MSLGCHICCRERNLFNDANKKLRGKHKALRYVFSDVKSFEAILNVLHTHIYKNTLFTFRLAEIFSNLPPHQTIGISWRTSTLTSLNTYKTNFLQSLGIFAREQTQSERSQKPCHRLRSGYGAEANGCKLITD
jgi:hypothetical protein